MRKQSSDLLGPRIGIDLVGSDTPPDQLADAVLLFLKEKSEPAQLTLFATEEVFVHSQFPPEVTLCPVAEVIQMDDDPLTAVRHKKNSSLCIGMQKLKEFELDAFVTAGNTGALMASAALTLPMLPGIEHPALLALIPTKEHPVAVLDVGAGVHVKAEALFQFALMGIAYQKARGNPQPKVGLLNIGTEKQKGTPELRKAYQLLQHLSPVFVGNIEGRDVFHGGIDVLVTDGFTGNVFLKTAEGIAAFILDQLQNLGPMASIPLMKEMVEKLRRRLHYAEYPGAILCGVDGVIVKCHGASSSKALLSSIKGAIRLTNHFFLEKIKHELKNVH
jgi:glycerol-3-phosphate acyltransferase PlsX